jgi:hypothetical protein
MIIAPSNRFNENCTYTFYNENIDVSKVVNADNSSVDIIAPTPIQNEDIAIEIIDVEKGKVEIFPILASGTYLPSKSTEYFKINEYSKEQVVLPVWEGPRKIFNFIIDLPKDVKIGDKLSVTTFVDLISNVTLNVELEGVSLKGRYEYIEQEKMDESQVEILEELFEKRIDYIEDQAQKEALKNQKANITRELKEARSNNDENHFANVSQKYEKVVAEMPATPTLTDEQFELIGSYIKSKLNPELKYSEFDIDNLCFHGKRLIKKGNTAEAQKCMDELIQIKDSVDLANSPEPFYDMCKVSVLQILIFAREYIDDPQADIAIVDTVNREYNKVHEELESLLTKYDDGHTSPEMKQDGQKLLQLTAGIYQAMQSVMPSDDASVSAYRGLVSKA